MAQQSYFWVLEKIQNANPKRFKYLYDHCSIIHNSQDKEAA